MIHSPVTLFANSLRLAIASLLFVGAVSAETGDVTQPDSEVWVSDIVVPYVLNVDLRDLPPAPEWQPGDPIKVVAESTVDDFAVAEDPTWQDPLRQRAGEGVTFAGALISAFPAIGFTGARPPDVVGDVGLNHYIAMANVTRFMIFDKEGTVLVPSTTLNSLWTASGGAPGSPCADGDGDPVVQYDELADRWLMTEFDITGNTFCFYLSQGPNPVTDGWYVYDFSAPSFPDYPQYGMWSDAYYVSSFESPSLGIYAFDRDQMLAGAAATFQRFAIPQLNGASPRVTRILPADHDGAVGPPVGVPNTFARTVDDTQDSGNPVDRIELWDFAVDFDTPANSSFTNVANLPLSPMTLLPCSPGVRDCIPQPGTANLIDALFNRPMRRLAWRNIGGQARMVMTQVVDAGSGQAGMRWWELRADDCLAGGCLGTDGFSNWSIFQEGTYAPDSVERFMGSIAMNADGDMALGYTVSDGTSVFPGIRATARRADDTLGTMTMDEITIKDGEGSQTSSQRWGDYSAMNVDPADGKTFWYTNEIILANGTWTTWVGHFALDSIFSDGFETGDTSLWSP